jgi:hypothetical protein
MALWKCWRQIGNKINAQRRNRPSASIAISAIYHCRPCASVRKCSVRSSAFRFGFAGARSLQHQSMLAIDGGLRAEAADIGRDDRSFHGRTEHLIW